MKTLTINGLVLTDQPPTKEGWWLFAEGPTCMNPFTETIKSRAHGMYALGEARGYVTEMGGFWHELIPRGVLAEEVEKAYREGYTNWHTSGWPESRAKLVAEGKESKV
jgi:hypothetical protein